MSATAPVCTSWEYDSTAALSVTEARRLIGVWTDDSMDAEIGRAITTCQRLLQDALRGPIVDGQWTDAFPRLAAGTDGYDLNTLLCLSHYRGYATDAALVAYGLTVGDGVATVDTSAYRIERGFTGYALRVTDADLLTGAALDTAIQTANSDTDSRFDNDGEITLAFRYIAPVWMPAKDVLSDPTEVDDRIKSALGELVVDAVENNGIPSDAAMHASVRVLGPLLGDTGVGA